jgi:peptidoglycan biosynthesis protein MviN/MurJ (putative lipid II flippase)
VITAFAQVVSIHAPLGFYQALHVVSFPAKVLIFEAFVNLLLSIWLAPRLGITGVALATAIPALLVSTMLLPPYLCRRLGVPIRTFIVASVLPGGFMLIVTLITLWLSGLMIKAESYPAIVARGMLTLPIAVALFTATFPAEQQDVAWELFGFRRDRVADTPKTDGISR